MPNRPPRVPGFSYIGPYQYFVTICTARRQRWFQEPRAATWLTDQISPLFEAGQFAVLAYCVMPDHVHLLVEGLTVDADFRSVIHRFKLRTGFAWTRKTGHKLWQTGFHEHVVRTDEAAPAIVSYLINNPVRAGLVDDVTRYPYIGSSRYNIGELADSARSWRPPWKSRR